MARSIEQENLREQTRKSEEAQRLLNNLLSQMSHNALDNATYKVGEEENQFDDSFYIYFRESLNEKKQEEQPQSQHNEERPPKFVEHYNAERSAAECKQTKRVSTENNPTERVQTSDSASHSEHISSEYTHTTDHTKITDSSANTEKSHILDKKTRQKYAQVQPNDSNRDLTPMSNGVFSSNSDKQSGLYNGTYQNASQSTDNTQKNGHISAQYRAQMDQKRVTVSKSFSLTSDKVTVDEKKIDQNSKKQIVNGNTLHSERIFLEEKPKITGEKISVVGRAVAGKRSDLFSKERIAETNISKKQVENISKKQVGKISKKQVGKVNTISGTDSLTNPLNNEREILHKNEESNTELSVVETGRATALKNISDYGDSRALVVNPNTYEEVPVTNSYNKNRIDMTAYADAVVMATRNSYRNSDYAAGKREVQQVTRLLGVGSVGRVAIHHDLASRYYLKNDEAIKLSDIIRNNPNTDRMKALSHASDLRISCSYSSPIKDFRNNSRILDNYLRGYGINASKLKKRDIDRMLKSGVINDGNGTPLKIDDNLKAVLQEKCRHLDLQETMIAAQRHSGGLSNTGKAWIQEAVFETDVYSGYQNVKGVISSAKAIDAVYRGVTGASIHTVAKGTNAVIKGGASIAELLDNKRHAKVMNSSASTAEKMTSLQKNELLKERVTVVKNNSGRISDRVIATNAKFTKTPGQKKVMAIGKFAGKQTGRVIAVSGKKAGKLLAKTKAGKAVVNSKAAGAFRRGVTKTKNKIEMLKFKKRHFDEIRNRITNAILRHTKIIRAPFKAVNFINQLKRKIIIFAAKGFLVLVVIIVCTVLPITAINSLLCSFFNTDTDIKVDQIGQLAIEGMRDVHSNYLKTLENQYGCPAEYAAPDGAIYKGDSTDRYEELSSPTMEAASCKLVTGYSRPYSVTQVYKAIISMATAKYENDKKYQDDIIQYCKDTMLLTLQNSQVTVYTGQNEEGATVNTRVEVCVNNSGLTNICRLDSFDWTKKGYFDTAQFNYELSDNDWLSLGADFGNSALQDAMASDLASGAGPTFNHLTEEQIQAILSSMGITPSHPLYAAMYYALSHVGDAYSQDNRFGANSFDCSSFVYRSLKESGIDVSYGGATTAAAICEGLTKAGKCIKTDMSGLKPGDLIFTADSTGANGRYCGINHVAMYIGNGMIAQATGTNQGVQYKAFSKSANPNKYYIVCRP